MISFLLSGYNGQLQYFTLSGQKHTYHRITYKHATCLDEGIMQVYNNFYDSINPFDRNTIISKVNRNEKVVLNSIFIEAFTRSMELAEKTSGIFDPTCAPLINLWGFGFEYKGDVTPKTIESTMEFVGYQKIELKKGMIVKQDPRIQLNFSAIGDGLACETIARYLDKQGVQDYIVDIGGEIIAKGKNKTGNDWSVGIIQPHKELGKDEEGKFSAIVHLSDRNALATSGNYNNFKKINGKLLGHTINPLIGYPVENLILSATFIASDCITADAYATAIMASEKEKLDELLNTNRELDYYIIYLDSLNNYQVKQSDGMKKYIH